MSTDAVPIDAAWSVLQDGDRVEKIAFLVPAAFGAAGAYTGAGGKVYDPDTGKFFTTGKAKAVDPITGGLIAEKELGTSAEDRAIGAIVGGAQAINPFGIVGKVAGKGLGRAGKALRGLRGTRQSKQAQLATAGVPAPLIDASGKVVDPAQAQRLMAQTQAVYPGARSTMTAPGVIDTTFSPSLRGAAANVGYGTAGATGRGLGFAGKVVPKVSAIAGRGMQAYGLAQQQGLEEGLLGLGGAYLQSQMPDATPQMSGGGGYGAGAGGYGQTGSYVQGNQDPYLEQDIWGGKEWGAQYGMKTAGDNMKIGEQLLKQIQEQAHQENLTKGKCPKCDKEPCACDDKKKAVCDKCGKEGCVSKMGCVAKADKCPHCDGDAPRSACICGKKEKAEGSKKPAHGMVIVIGTKAGPGPSKDGKRQKLDSEKKDD